MINHNPKELIGAQINWWSGSSAGPLLTNPLVGDIFSLKKGSSAETDSLFQVYNQATELYRDSLWLDAIDIYSQVLMAAPDDSLGLRSLVSIAACYGYMEDDGAYISFVDGIGLDYNGTLVGEVASDFAVTYLAQHDELGVALAASAEVLDEYPSIPNTNEVVAFAYYERSTILEELARQEAGLGKTSQALLYEKQSEACLIKILQQYGNTGMANLLRTMGDYPDYPEPVAQKPGKYVLFPAYPNPFNPSTTIQYELPKMADITIAVYDLLGRSIWSYEESAKAADYYSLQWNGLNDNGKQVASGVYLISFSTPEFRAVQKAVLIR